MKTSSRNKAIATGGALLLLLLLLRKKKNTFFPTGDLSERVIEAVGILADGVQVFYTCGTNEVYSTDNVPDIVKEFVNNGGKTYDFRNESIEYSVEFGMCGGQFYDFRQKYDTELDYQFDTSSISGIGGSSARDFTPEWNGYKGKDALRKIMKEKRGVCRDAYEVDGMSVDIIWGKVTNSQLHKGFGLSHIIDKHELEIKAKGFDIIDIIDLCLNNGLFNSEKSDTKRRRYDYGKSSAVLALDIKNDSVWLLTGYFNM